MRDVPLEDAVIVWQPPWLRRRVGDARAGAVQVLPLYDRRERFFAKTHGASWCDWAIQPIEELLDALEWLKSELVRTEGISADRIEQAFSCIPEWRNSRRIDPKK
jgi:hypothetical protein